MENRSNNLLVGIVVIALTLAGLLFTVWLSGLSGRDAKPYDILFPQSVEGLARGSAVTFSGVPVGKVEDIVLMPDNPELVRVRISVDEEVPILQGTNATIANVGFTGVSQINLDGAMKGAPPITAPGPEGVPLIPTKPGALGELLNSAPRLLERLTTLSEKLTDLLSDQNQKSITGILHNVDRLSGDLAARGPEIAATLAETRIAIRQAGDAAEQIGLVAEDARPALRNLDRAATSAQRSMDRLDAVLADAQPGMQALSTQTVPELNQLVTDLSEMSHALSAVANRLDRQGAGSVIGGNKLPEYEPRR